MLHEILPARGKNFRFTYEYDFGDSWIHEILFEGSSEPGKAKEYPLCVKGAGACPPEDVGGIWGYYDFLETITGSEDEDDEMDQDSSDEFDNCEGIQSRRRDQEDAGGGGGLVRFGDSWRQRRRMRR
jgi:hypothetical protein